MRSTLVAPDTIGYIWPQVEKFIHSAFETEIGDDTEADVVAMLGRGEAQLWIAHNGAGIKAAAISRMAVMPNGKKVCFYVACGGKDIAEWEDCIDDIEKYAQKHGCDKARATGRPGWKKIFKERGYKEPFIVLEKVLNA